MRGHWSVLAVPCYFQGHGMGKGATGQLWAMDYVPIGTAPWSLAWPGELDSPICITGTEFSNTARRRPWGTCPWQELESSSAQSPGQGRAGLWADLVCTRLAGPSTGDHSGAPAGP